MKLTRRHFLGAGCAAIAAPAFGQQPEMRAYNLELENRSIGESDARGDGWAFGLPPGISRAQWPLDPNNGYPLNHGFTLRLPEDYRVHGPEIVALSFFATAFDHNEGMPLVAPAVRAFFDEETTSRPKDPDLLPFWEAQQSAHPRLYRMRDVLDLEYAVILLTEQEFSGGFVQPPSLFGNRHLASIPAPAWLSRGSALAFWEASYSPAGLLPPEDYFIYRQLGGVPPSDLAFNRAIAITARTEDPNAGIPPREYGETDYQQDFTGRTA